MIEDEEIRFVSNSNGPTVAGAFNYNGTEFVMRDAMGTFNPRSSASAFTTSGTRIETAFTALFPAGLSGSLTQLADGSSYLVAGANVTIATSSNGQVTISAIGGGGSGGGGNDYWQSTTENIIFNTGSIRQGTAVFIDPPVTNSIALSSQGSARMYGGLSNAIISSDYSKVRTTHGSAFNVRSNTIISDFLSEIDGYISASTMFNLIAAGGSHRIESGSQFNAIIGSAGVNIASGSLINGTLAAGDTLFTTISTLDNTAGSAIIAGGPNIISSSDGNTIINSAIIGSNWTITSSRVYAIGDTVNTARVLVSASNGVEITGQTKFFSGISGSLTQLADGTPYLLAGAGVRVTTGSTGAVTVSSNAPSSKQLVNYATTTTTLPAVIGQFSWVPSDYTGLTSVTLRAVMSVGAARHTGSLQVYNLTSGSYLDLVNTPTTGKHFTITSSMPTLLTSSNLLSGITNFNNNSNSVYEIRVSGSSANSTFVGGVEIVFR